MNYYPHHIGDFNNATRHLTRVERALYRELIELYYDTEKPLPADDFPGLCKRVLANDPAEHAMVAAILGEFFDRDGDVWCHRRCDEVIAEYKAKLETASKAGKASAKVRKAAAKAKSAHVDRALNDRSTSVQPTNNQEPITKNKEQSAQRSRGSRLPDGWKPSEVLLAWAAKERPDLNPAATLARFTDHWRSAPGSRGVKLDWDATFRNWVRNEKAARGAPTASAPPPQAKSEPCPCGAPGKVKVGGRWRCDAHVRGFEATA